MSDMIETPQTAQPPAQFTGLQPLIDDDDVHIDTLPKPPRRRSNRRRWITTAVVVVLLLGPIGAVVLSHTNNYPFVVDPSSVLIAFGVAAIVGIVFGFYPAQRAARMDPIVALRTE